MVGSVFLIKFFFGVFFIKGMISFGRMSLFFVEGNKYWLVMDIYCVICVCNNGFLGCRVFVLYKLLMY